LSVIAAGLTAAVAHHLGDQRAGFEIEDQRLAAVDLATHPGQFVVVHPGRGCETGHARRGHRPGGLGTSEIAGHAHLLCIGTRGHL